MVDMEKGKEASVEETSSLQDDEDICMIVAQDTDEMQKTKSKKMKKQIPLKQAFQGKGTPSSKTVVEFKPRLRAGPRKYFVEPPAYILKGQQQRQDRKRKQAENAQAIRLDGQYMHWDNLVVAMVLEKAKQLDYRGGFSVSKSIKWFQSQFPHIENFQRLKESTVRAWRQKGIYRKIRGRKAVNEERKALVKSWLSDIVRPTQVNVPTTIDFIWKTVQAKMDRERKAESEAGRSEPELLKGWKMSKSWFTNFIYKDLGLSLRQETTGRELPDNWEELKMAFCDRLAIRAKEFNITPDLVVNADQTGWHLAPHRGRTLARRGDKSVPMFAHNDKRQVTMMVGLSASGEILPLQFIFKGKADKVKSNSHHHYASKHDWLFSTNPERHWANLSTMKEWVGKVLHPYFCQKLVEKHLIQGYSGGSVKVEDINQRCVLVLDCWKVHISKAFTNWMKEKYPYILLLFVPARCTSKLQVVDLVGNYKLKALAVKEFEKYLLKSIHQQIELNENRINQGIDPVGYTLDLKMTTLRDKVPEWAEKGFTWFQTTEGRDLILKGWRSCGLLNAFSSLYQLQALDRMFVTMEMDETKRREWEAFNCTQKDLGIITEESCRRWEDKVNEELDIDPDQDEPGMVDNESPEMGKSPNAMQADSEDDFGLWTRFCAFATQHIKLKTIDEDMIEQHGKSSWWYKNKKQKGQTEATGQQSTRRKRGRPRKIPVTIVEDVEQEDGEETCQIIEDVFDDNDDDDQPETDDEDAYSVHDTEESGAEESDEEVEEA